ncbi:C39 family peptidase [Nocardioides ferulae]|uniref:C39 family peptidase n=1 Tax=Nocardioides ferulae TaxID=2340821 RepID=UPI000EB35CB6|nr:C39 family peptidase [Nocardioides ferulae]
MRRSLALLSAVLPMVASLLAVGPGLDAGAGAAAAAISAPAAAAPARNVSYVEWDTPAELRTGVRRGVAVKRGALVLAADPARSRRHAGRRFDAGSWTSPWTAPAFALTELIASWDARTPGDSWVEISVRGQDGQGRTSSWDVLGRWAAGDKAFRRTSVSGQGDDLADVAVDTWRANSAEGLTRWQLRVGLMRGAGADSPSPRVDTIGAVATRLPDVDSVPTSRPGVARGVVLDVPRYSQMVHDGHYPAYGGGGEAWCSPTSTSMVLGYYDALPPKRAWSFVPKGHPQPWVDAAARATYDHAYRGTGNWPFNTAFAATRTGRAFVTRLRSMKEAERFIAAGIPLVISVAFGRGELSGAPISSTNGHLMVVVGFTDDGDVVVNDPAAATNAGVRRTYDRGQLEDVWLPASGGVTYVITDADHPLPEGGRGAW